jgi:hypothetical protein
MVKQIVRKRPAAAVCPAMLTITSLSCPAIDQVTSDSGTRRRARSLSVAGRGVGPQIGYLVLIGGMRGFISMKA